MASKYDEIKTAAELVREVRVHGLSLAQEDICRAQDIFGHTTIDELEKLANDNGRTDDNGKPDPNGAWSSGREGTQRVFYSILFHIWNWEDATRFWKQHTDPEYKKMKAAMEAAGRDQAERIGRIKELEKRCDMLVENEVLVADTAEAMRVEAASERKRAERAEFEIVKLKARLYDLMFKEGEG